MCARDLTDIYTRSPRAAGPRAEGVYISQIMSTHGITNMCHFYPTEAIHQRIKVWNIVVIPGV